MARQLNPDLCFTDPTKFAPKLSTEDRCFAMALYNHGATAKAVATFLSIHVRTMTAIIHGPAYKEIRAAYERMGHEGFQAAYLDEARVEEFRQFVRKRKEAEGANFAESRQSLDPDKPGWYAQKNATAKAGTHDKIAADTGLKVKVLIEWRGSTIEHKEGWFWFIQGYARRGPFAKSMMAYDDSMRVWDPKNAPESSEDRIAKQVAVAKEQRLAALKLSASAARRLMVAQPSTVTVQAFVTAASLIWSEEGYEFNVNDVDWQGFDPSPFGVVLNTEERAAPNE